MLIPRARHTQRQERREARRKRRAFVVSRDAVIVGQHRYLLERVLDCGEGTLLVIMVNPSKADAFRDDHTITKLIEFCRRLGYRRLIVGNLLSYRATDIATLWDRADCLGLSNHVYLKDAMRQADRVVVAWGRCDKLPTIYQQQWHWVRDEAKRQGKSLYCWGVNRDGHPKHPLRLAYKTRLREWMP